MSLWVYICIHIFFGIILTGTLSQDISIGTLTNPIKFGVSHSLSNSDIHSLQTFFDTYKDSDGVYIKVLRTNDPIDDLQNIKIHVNLLDAAQGYISWRRYRHQVLIVEQTASLNTFSEIQLVKKTNSSSDMSSILTDSVCGTEFLSAETLLLHQTLVTTGIISPSSQSSRIDLCESVFSTGMSNLKGCIPASRVGSMGVCSMCGTENNPQVGSIGLRGSSIESTTDCENGLYGGATQTMARVMTGVCDVGVVRSHLYHSLCRAPLLTSHRSSYTGIKSLTQNGSVPYWCATSSTSPLTSISTLGHIPTKTFMVRPNLIIPVRLKLLFFALKQLGTIEPLSRLLDLEGVGLPVSSRPSSGSSGVIENWATDFCSQTHFSQHSFDTFMQSVPGVDEYVSCVGCLESSFRCLRGHSSSFPLRLALPVHHSLLNTYPVISEFEEALSSSSSPSPLYIKVVGGEYGGVESIRRGYTDLTFLSSFEAHLAHQQFSYSALAFELQNNKADDSQGLDTYSAMYRPSFVALKDTFSDNTLGDLSDLKSQRVCGGSLMGSGTISLFTEGLRLNLTAFPSVEPSQALYSCQSPLLHFAASLFASSSCLPSHQHRPSVCESCPQYCSSFSPYLSPEGTINGLVDNVCDVALARNNTIVNTCEYHNGKNGYPNSPSWCQSSANEPSVVNLAAPSLPPVPTDVLIVNPLSLHPSVTSTIHHLVDTIVDNSHFYTHLLPLLKYDHLVSVSQADPQHAFTSTSIHLEPIDNLLSSPPFLPLSTSTAASDTPFPLPYPNCSYRSRGLKGSAENPIVFALPPSSSPLVLSQFDLFSTSVRELTKLSSFSHSNSHIYASGAPGLEDGIHITYSLIPDSVSPLSVPSRFDSIDLGTDTLSLLERELVDVAIVDPAVAFMGATRYRHQVLTTFNNTFSHQPHLTEVSLYSLATSNITSTSLTDPSSLQSLRVCLGDPSGMAAAVVHQHLISAGSLTSTPPSPSFDNAIDQCNSSLLSSFSSTFLSVCAPPAKRGLVSDCSGCSLGGVTCNHQHPYYGHQGALRGLYDGVCDVAVLDSHTPQIFCPKDGQNIPDWCRNVDVDLIPLFPPISIPVPAALIKPHVLSPSLLSSLTTAIISMTTFPHLLHHFSLFPSSYMTSPSSIALAPGSIDATEAYLSLFTSSTPLPHALLPYELCLFAPSPPCLSRISNNCPHHRGTSSSHPLLFALPPSAWGQNSRLVIQNYFDKASVKHDIHIRAVVPSHISSLSLNPSLLSPSPSFSRARASSFHFAADHIQIGLLDSLDAAIAYRKHGARVLLGEVTQVDDAMTYKLAVWVNSPHSKLPSPAITSLSDLQGKRLCVGPYDSSVYQGFLSHLLQHNILTPTNSTQSHQFDSCRSENHQLLAAFAQSLCSPPAFGFPSFPNSACAEFPLLFSSHIGSLRGLVEGLCDAAIARDSTLLDACDTTSPEPWCSVFSHTNPDSSNPSNTNTSLFPKPIVLTHATDNSIHNSDYLGIYPGDMLMVSSDALLLPSHTGTNVSSNDNTNVDIVTTQSSSRSLSLYKIFSEMNSDKQLLSLLGIRRGLRLPIDNTLDIGSKNATNLALSSLFSKIHLIPNFKSYLDSKHVFNNNINDCNVASLSHLTNSTLLLNFGEIDRYLNTETSILTDQANQYYYPSFSPSTSLPLTETDFSPLSPSNCLPLTLSLPLPSVSHRNLWLEHLKPLSLLGICVKLVHNNLSYKDLARNKIDLLWIDGVNTALGHLHYDQRALLIGAYFRNPSRTLNRTRTTSHTSSLVSTEIVETITSTLDVTTSYSPYSLAQSVSGVDVSRWDDLMSRRVCLPNYNLFHMLMLSTPSFLSAWGLSSDSSNKGLNGPLLDILDSNTCSAIKNDPSLKQHPISSKLGSSCLPPSDPLDPGICDLCTPSNSHLSPSSNPSPIEYCSSSNSFASDTGSLQSLILKACEVILLSTDYLSTFCNLEAHPLSCLPQKSSTDGNTPICINPFSNNYDLPTLLPHLCTSKVGIKKSNLKSHPMPSHSFLANPSFIRTFSPSSMSLLVSLLINTPAPLLQTLGVHALVLPSVASTSKTNPTQVNMEYRTITTISPHHSKPTIIFSHSNPLSFLFNSTSSLFPSYTDSLTTRKHVKSILDLLFPSPQFQCKQTLLNILESFGNIDSENQSCNLYSYNSCFNYFKYTPL